MIANGSDTGGSAERESPQWLDRKAAAVSEDASCVGQWQVDRLRADAGSGVSDAEVRNALERWGVQVAELPRLPAGPPSAIAQYPGYVDAIARLGRKLSIELVFGNGLKNGFSLLGGIRLQDGRRLDRAAIEKALERTPPGAHHEDWDRVLSILADCAREPGALDDMVLWEVVEVLRPLARLGYSQRAITEQAVRLSLERDQAEMLAAAVAEEHQLQEAPRRSERPRIEHGAAAADRTATRAPRGEPDPGASGPASVQLLQPVTDLQVRSMRGRTDVVQLSWSPPPAGSVTLRMAGEPAPWQLGTTIARDDADSYGRPLNATGVPGPDRRMSCELALPQARTFVTAITAGDVNAAVGRTVEITRNAPVRGLSARRFGGEVWLTWIWPDEAASAYVAWQPSAAAEDQHGAPVARQQRSCSRRAFEAEGGFAAVMGHVAQRVAVWAVITANGEEHVTIPAEIEVPAIGTPVHYDFRPVPGLLNGFLTLAGRRRQRELQLLAELPCVLPDLIVVECKHSAMPLAPHDDEIVARIPGRPIDPGVPFRKVIQLGKDGPSWLACFVDPAKSGAARARVTLMNPPVGRQRVK